MSTMVLTALRQIIRALDLRSRQLAKTVGLTVPQLVVLQAVAASGALPTGRIAEQVSLSQATVTNIVDRLELRGLLERRRGTIDRRQVQLAVTGAGSELLARSPTILHEEFLGQFYGFEPWEQAQMLSTLQRVSSMMKAQELPDAPLIPADGLIADEDLDPAARAIAD
jgi:DNA-binding MarR family transcriptional regulator